MKDWFGMEMRIQDETENREMNGEVISVVQSKV